jgi:hypothetical protein
MAIIDDVLAQAINNLSPGHQVHKIGTRLQQALAGELPAGSVSTEELANDAVTSEKILDGEVGSDDIAVNAVTLSKIAAGLLIGIASDEAKTTDRDENIDGLASAIVLANALKATMNTHAANATEHTTAADTVNFPVTEDDCDDLASMLALTGLLLTAYDVHEDDSELGAAWAYHEGQEGGDASPTSAVTPTDLNEALTRLNDLKAKYNTHDADASSHFAGTTAQESAADVAYGITILVVEADVLSGDVIVWSILDSGTGTVVGASAVAAAGGITFGFDAEPQGDCIISYAVFRAAP